MITKPKSNDRGTLFSCVFYGQFDELQFVLMKSKHYVYILHDMEDTDPHYHIVIQFHNQRTITAVVKDFVSRANVQVELVRGLSGTIDYLTHENNPEKYQYSRDRLRSDSLSYWLSKCIDNQKISKEDEIEHFCEDLVSLCHGTITLKAMACRYGRDFIKNFNSYREFGYQLCNEVEKDYYDKNRLKRMELNNDEDLL